MSNMNMLISVIVPIYKVERELNQCIESIVNQTYKNIEIVLVDDGSPDSCPEICDNWSLKDERIRVVHKKNEGLSAARNTGIDIARGDYIGFVDSDDFINSRMYENLLATAVKYNTLIAACGRVCFRDGEDVNKGKKRFVSKQKVYSCEEAIQCALLGQHIDVAAWDKIYKREIFDNIRYPIGENNEDVAIFYKLFQKSEIISHTGTCEYYYRTRKGSISQTQYSKKLREDTYLHHKALKDFILKEHPKLLDDYYKYHVLNVFYFLVNYLKSNNNRTDLEYSTLLKEFKLYKLYFYNNNLVTAKDKIIGILINLDIYNKYISIKRRFFDESKCNENSK